MPWITVYVYVMQLLDFPQVGGMVSIKLTVSKISPQGCCLSPKLMHTHDCVSTQNDTILIKYADNTTILGLIKREDESGYRILVNNILVHGEENDLIINTHKSREIILDFYSLLSSRD